jgi:hypothetical protein
MICPMAKCARNVQPVGLPTGLQELLAMRIHLLKDHGVYRSMNQVMELRLDDEHSGMQKREVIWIDVEALEERWLR